MKLDRQQIVPLFTESFEAVTTPFGHGFPSDAGVWSGDFAAVVPAEAEISPKDGKYSK